MSGSNSLCEVVALGIGSAGIRIVSALSRETTLVDRFAYLTCDEADLEAAGDGERLVIESPMVQKPSPSMVRGFAMRHHDEMRKLVKDANGVFVVDNSSLFNSASEATLKDLHDLANKEAVKALGSLLAKQSQDSIPV